MPNAANGWEAKVWGAAPDWLKIRDADAVKGFYEGYPRGQEQVPWGAWIGPLSAWCILAALFLAASFFLASLLRRQWVERERFAFPLVSVPLLLSEEPERGRLLKRDPMYF